MKEKYLKSLIVIVVIIIGGLFIYQNISKENKPLPEVKLKEIINKDKSFAIMIQENSETDKYQEYDSNTWPGDDYKFKEAKCIDNNGDEIKEAVTYEDGKITLTTNKTVYCTVYFDKSIIGKLRETDTQKYLSEDKQGEMYRYQGTDDVHNWICFGTIDNCGTNDDNIDKYMYRIIGITPEGQLYLIKETFLKEGNATGFQWNSKYSISDCLGEVCEWPNTDIYKRLNGESSNGNPIFINNSFYEYMVQENKWYNLIEDHSWLYGDTNDSDTLNKYNGDEMYNIENGTTSTTHFVGAEKNNIVQTYTWTNKINAKISLMYWHDYYYSYYDGNDENSRGNAESYSKLANSWLHFRKDGYNTSDSYEWLSTRWGIASLTATYFDVFQIGTADSWIIRGGLLNRHGVRPIFYLSSKARIASGDGTKTNPYIIEILNTQD